MSDILKVISEIQENPLVSLELKNLALQIGNLSLVTEQKLDQIYHAIPEWVHRQYPDKTLGEKIKLGFEYQQKSWTDSFLREMNDHEKVKAFLLYLTKTHGMDFGQEYWNYLTSKDLDSNKKELTSLAPSAK